MTVMAHVTIVSALMRRDLIVRFGRENIGFAWVFVEPMLLTLGVMLIWSMIKPPFDHGVHIVMLVVTGYLPLTLFRHITNAGTNIMRASTGLLYHRAVSIWHIMVSRTLIEFVGTTIAFVIIYYTLYTFGQIALIEDPRLVISAWFLVAYFSIGVGLVIATITQLSEVAERFVQTFQYLQLPISGCFFMVDWLPTEAQRLILWNPFVHGFEMIRAGFYGSLVPTYYSASYMIAVSTLLVVIGIMGVNRARRTLEIG